MTAARKTPRVDQLAALDERAAAAAQDARAMAEAVAQHATTIEGLKAERVEAYAAGDERKATAAKKQAAAAEAQATELEERREGAAIAVHRAQQECDAFTVEHHQAIVTERKPIADVAVRAIEDAIAALREGVKMWTTESNVQIALLRPIADRDGREIPDLGEVARLTRDLQRAVSDGVVPPLPGGVAHITAREPEPEPEGDLRDAARAALRVTRERKAKRAPDVESAPSAQVFG